MRWTTETLGAVRAYVFIAVAAFLVVAYLIAR